MKHNTIHQLLERYFEGETSLAEEQQLQKYFQSDEIAPDLLRYQSLFRFFTAEKEQQTSSKFEQQLQQAPSYMRVRSKRSPYRWAIAATIALLIAMGGYWLNQQEVIPARTASAIDWSKYEPQTEAEALLITKKALTRTTKVIQQSMATANGELENIQEILQPFK